MADERFLVVRVGSLGDIVHALPAIAALRDSFPLAHIAWVVERQWRALLDGNPDLNEVIALDRRSWSGALDCLRRLRAGHYTCALDFQGLYKSALLAFLSGARERIGFDGRYARERAASVLYTRKVTPAGSHVIEHNLSIAEAAGARRTAIRFALPVSAEADIFLDRELTARGLRDFFVLSPGAGWGSKRWPAERFGELHRELTRRTGWGGVVSFSPGEAELAERVRAAAGSPEPVLLPMNLAQLMAALRRAKVVVAGDTGPLHLASALGARVVGLYGPTDPARNGPYSPRNIVVRNAKPDETTYKRGSAPAASMMSITVAQVLEAVERRLRSE
ncbi:MAG TPA: glycosyltransferase family 9 protein [Candidatus Acidoferrales bacterium]|jgi:lipopolysaccharide heptosyltransferase I|nr:glycosyltransferase family 9 protein [Candidatus Acidoferrales bacterium]